MTAVHLDLLHDEPVVARPRPVPVVLARQEGLRVVRHPVWLLGAAAHLWLLLALSDNGPREAFEAVTSGVTWFVGVPTFFAAHLVATRDRRAHAGELLAPLPAPVPQRVLGQCLAALVPTAVAAAVVVLAHLALLADDRYLLAPGPWHLSHGPLTVLGAALLGTAVARLSHVPGTALLVMTGLVLLTAWMNSRPQLHATAVYVDWARWSDYPRTWAGLHPGSPAWHTGSLLALSGLAGAGAFLRGTGRTRTAVAAGAVLAAAAVACGLLTVP